MLLDGEDIEREGELMLLDGELMLGLERLMLLEGLLMRGLEERFMLLEGLTLLLGCALLGRIAPPLLRLYVLLRL